MAVPVDKRTSRVRRDPHRVGRVQTVDAVGCAGVGRVPGIGTDQYPPGLAQVRALAQPACKGGCFIAAPPESDHPAAAPVQAARDADGAIAADVIGQHQQVADLRQA